LLLTPDGRLISSCRRSRDFSVKVWDIEQGVLLHSLEAHTDGVDILLLTPDGRLISSCSSSIFSIRKDYSVKVWDIVQAVVLHSLNEYITSIQYMILSRMPDYFVTTGGNQFTVWNWHEGKKVAQFTTDGAIYTSIQAEDDTMIVGDGLGRVHFLRLVTP